MSNEKSFLGGVLQIDNVPVHVVLVDAIELAAVAILRKFQSIHSFN